MNGKTAKFIRRNVAQIAKPVDFRTMYRRIKKKYNKMGPHGKVFIKHSLIEAVRVKNDENNSRAESSANL
jgi:hypothetical protein